MDDLEFILYVKDNINIVKICKDNNIRYENMIRGRTTKENTKKVADELKLAINKCYSSIVLDRSI